MGCKDGNSCALCGACTVHTETRLTQSRNSFALVLAGGRGSRLGGLTDRRAKPALPFAGTMRIVDFASGNGVNCVNCGLWRIGLLTRYKAQSLIGPVERSSGFLESSLGEFVDIVPAQQHTSER